MSNNSNEVLRLIDKCRRNKEKRLDLSMQRLIVIPDQVYDLIWLEELILDENKLSDLSSSISSLSNLTHLSLRNNKLSILPDSIFHLSNLSFLSLRYNKLSDLSSSISSLSNLTQLWLCGNQLNGLPSSLSNLSNLTHLSLSYIQLRNLPDAIFDLTNLTFLDLRGNELRNLPDSISKLHNMTWLDLSDNKLTDLPKTISILSQLTELRAANNQFSELPDSLISLSGLTILRLGGNQFIELPPSISRLSSLTVLTLGNNQLKELPNSIATLFNLKDLDLCNNLLNKLPDSIGNLSGLANLWLEGNRLTQLSDSIGHLNKLIELSLSYNQLSELPKSLIELSSLKTLNLEGNPINLPEELLVDNVKDLFNYLRQQKEQGITPLHEAKLLLVGQGQAGKTTLMEKLLDNSYNIGNRHESTLGIDVRSWEFPLTSNKRKRFTANIWDFGGQEIQYMTHQFFLTNRSLYVLVANDRSQDTNYDYWFNVIKVFGAGGPLIVLLNKRDGCDSTNFSEMQYRRRFPEVNFKVMEVNLVDDNDGKDSFEELNKLIQKKLSSLKHVGEGRPKTWQKIRKVLIELGESKPRISWKGFQRICSDNGLKEEEDQKVLSQYLHCLGILLHYQDDQELKDLVILDPHWVTKSLYTVLKNPKVEKERGFFTSDWLYKEWKKEKYGQHTYTSDDCRKLMKLMLKNKFELCYKLKGRSYVVPQLLPPSRPDDFVGLEGPTLKFRYLYPFMPEGTMARIIVRLHEYIDSKCVWKNGVVLTKDKCRALIEKNEDSQGRRYIGIQVDGVGDFRFSLLAIIIQELEVLHKREKGSHSTKRMLACVCKECSEAQEPHFYLYEDILNFAEKGKNLQCMKSTDLVSVKELIKGVCDTKLLEVKHSANRSGFDQVLEMRGDTFSEELFGHRERETQLMMDFVANIFQIANNKRPQDLNLQIDNRSSSHSDSKSKSKAEVDVKVSVEIKQTFKGLAGDLAAFKKKLEKIDDTESEELIEEIGEAQESLEKEEEPTAASAALSGMKGVLEEFVEPDSKALKALEKVSGGVRKLQSIGRGYNKVANAIGLNSIPSFLVGKSE